MTEGLTIRERVERAVAFLHRRDAVVLTTFNLNANFLEDQVLPIVLDVEAKAAAARRAEVHQQLGAIACTVFYDPNVPPKISGRFRYVTQPVPILGRFFHPKLVILSGKDENGVDWVYLGVSSANLTMSGWGRNAEVYGETWIHTRGQQSWGALDELLGWLQQRAAVGAAGYATDAVSRVRAALARMPDRKRFADNSDMPWSGTLYAKFYSSVVHRKGLADFMRDGRAHRPSQLWACSPYWSEVSEGIGAFDAHDTLLFPALRTDRSALSLAQSQREDVAGLAEIFRNPKDNTERYWHMKAYALCFRETWFTAVGSCNFTHAGLVGAAGNVEAALVFEGDADWFPADEIEATEDFADDVLQEEGIPEPTPVQIVVAFDWRSRTWRWWLKAGRGQHNFRLQLPGQQPIATHAGTHEHDAPPPPRAATFTVSYQSRADTHTWHGHVVELNLDHSGRVYGRPLTATEILDSWRGQPLSWDLGGGGGPGDGEGEAEDIEHEAPAAFDAVNLYDLYRSMRSLRAELRGLAEHPEDRHARLVGRPNSVVALANLAHSNTPAPVVRHLVLQEVCGVLSDWSEDVDPMLLARVQEMATRSRQVAHNQLTHELGARGSSADEMLTWFERRLAALSSHGDVAGVAQ